MPGSCLLRLHVVDGGVGLLVGLLLGRSGLLRNLGVRELLLKLSLLKCELLLEINIWVIVV